MNINQIDQLIQGLSPESIGLSILGTRLHMHDQKVRQHNVSTDVRFRGTKFTKVENPILAKGLHWSGLHFTRCNLNCAMFKACRWSDCIFEDCVCRDVGFWDCLVENCQFIRTDLRDVAFGGVNQGAPSPNIYQRVVFDQCDMRGSAHSVERYEACVFRNCRLSQVDFVGAVFEDCTFQGSLDEVNFRNIDPLHPTLPPNRLLRCDFRGADVKTCGFLNLDLDPTSFASDPDLLVLPHGPRDWERLLVCIHGAGNEGKRSFIEEEAKFAGTPTIISRTYLRGVFSEDEVKCLEEIAHGGAY